MRDLDIQRERAELLIETLYDFVEVVEFVEDGETYHRPDMTVRGMLDALACCGFVLQEGNDAGMALMDGLINSLDSDANA